MSWKAFSLFLLVLLLYLDTAFSKKKNTCANNRNKYQMLSKKRASEDINEKCECGKLGTENEETPLIVGAGSIVNPIYKYPWMVAVFIGDKLYCGASIISQNYVLTAAHCVSLSEDQAVLEGVYHPSNCKTYEGEKFCSVPVNVLKLRYNAEKDGLEYVVDIHSMRLPSEYHATVVQYDVALLKTSTKLPCDKFTAPICLPKLPGLYCPGANAITTGWGQSELATFDIPNPSEAILREAKLVLQKTEVCDAIRISLDHVCALGDNQNACHGDSGGPLVEKFNGVHYLIGITSFGESDLDCDYRKPVFYSKVKTYLPWIMKTIAQQGQSKTKTKGKKYVKKVCKKKRPRT